MQSAGQKYRSSTVRTMGRVGKLGETRVARFRSWRKRKGRRRANSNFELAKPVSPSSVGWRSSIAFLARSQMCALHYLVLNASAKECVLRDWEEYKQAQVVPRNP